MMKKSVARDSLFYAPRLPRMARQELYSSLSHVFRGPLMGASGYVDYLFKGYAGPLTGEQEQQLLKVRESLKNLNGVIESFLDVIALDLELVERIPGAVSDPCAALAAIKGEFRGQIYRKRLSVHTVAGVCRPCIPMPDEWLKVMAREMVSAALRFAAPGECVRAVTSCGAKDIEISVSGFGRKMPPELKRDLFRPFLQVPFSGLPEGARRSGLGLMLVKKIAMAHGARVKSFYSEDEGMTVSIKFSNKRAD